MTRDWMLTSWDRAALVIASALIIYGTVIVLSRLNGLRRFAKMSAFDFATTVAMGTLLASSLATQDPPVLQAMVGLGALFVLQYVVARLRLRSGRFRSAVDNRPLLLMRDGELLRENMRRARVTESDLWSQLRMANVSGPGAVVAVVMDTTGDISVLHGNRALFDERLLAGLRMDEH